MDDGADVCVCVSCECSVSRSSLMMQGGLNTGIWRGGGGIDEEGPHGNAPELNRKYWWEKSLEAWKKLAVLSDSGGVTNQSCQIFNLHKSFHQIRRSSFF